jgi:KDO2-lipid IV(A) lauroyltransferase
MAKSVATQLRAASEWVEAALLKGVIGGLRCLSPVAASNLGGALARTVGPFLPISRVADDNLRRALPELDAAARARVIRGVWDNLGRTVAELPHLGSFKRTESGAGWEIDGEEQLAGLGTSERQVLFATGHIGNWEMMLPIAEVLGIRMAGIYRTASNEAVDRVIQSLRFRAFGRTVTMFPKGSQGARAALQFLRDGGSLGLLVDQKMNDGIAVPFFGRDAMTAPALAQFARHFSVPILPVHIVRLGPARFRLVCDPPLPVTLTGDRTADLYEITLAINQTLERWIRADPAAWLWLHRRWPKA